MMRHFRLLGVAVVALSVLGVAMVGSASAALLLPEIVITLVSEGAAYPIHLDVTLLTLATKLSNEDIPLEGVGLLVLYLALELTSLGSFAALFLNVKEKGGLVCHSEGDPAGELLTHGTWHLVYTSLNVGAQPLNIGVLHLVSPFNLICGSLTIKLRGSELAGVAPRITGQLTSLTASLTGNGLGTPTTPTAYYNDEGQVKKAKLEENLGSGFVEVAEETGAVTVFILKPGSNMFEIEQPNP